MAEMGLHQEAACKLPVAERTAGNDLQHLVKHQRRHCNFTPGRLRFFRLTPSLRRLPSQYARETRINLQRALNPFEHKYSK